MILTCIDSSIFIRKEGKKDLGVTLSPRVKKNCLTLKEKMNNGGTLNITINSLRVDSYGQEAKTEVVYAGTCVILQLRAALQSIGRCFRLVT